MNKRTDSICCVDLHIVLPVYVEANSPEEAFKWVVENIDNFNIDQFDLDDCNLEAFAYETYTTVSADYMNKIFLQDGRVISYNKYVDELEEGGKA